MKYTLSHHARKQILRRKIRVEWIEITLNYPARTETMTSTLLWLMQYDRFQSKVSEFCE